jgi:penicillin-binding protein 1C
MLTPAQAAFLAALPQRPSTFNPYRDPEGARARQRRILERMVSLGLLSADESREARAERLALRREPAVFIAPHFVQRVLATIEDPHPRRVVTTVDAELQREVEDIIRAQRSTLERHGAHNVAAVVLDNATGDWLAWEGSGDYADEKHGGSIDGAVTPRQPGSALKPFTYALAFESGDTPATVLPDVPSYFPTAQEGVVYSPQNYDGRYRGPLLARRALAGSENVPAVALASRIGVPSLLRYLRRSGFSTFDRTAAHYGLGLTLGDAEVRLDELVPAYASFARGGIAIQPRMLRMVSAPRDAASLTGERLMSPRTAFWISDILSDPSAREYAFGRGSSLEFSFAVAAKTGTSQAYRDNWAVGFTRAVTVGVWVGNFDRAPLINSSGVTGAGPLFHAILIAAERRVRGSLPEIQELPTIAVPERVERRTICALSGQTANRWCPAQVEEWVAVESPATICRWHQAVDRGARVAWPPEYRPWAQSQGVAAVLIDEPLAPRAEDSEPALRIVNPPPGAIYLVDPTLRPAFQTLALRVVTGRRSSIEWRLDGRRLGSAQSDTAFDWPLEVGRHTFSALDHVGHQSEVTILVK